MCVCNCGKEKKLEVPSLKYINDFFNLHCSIDILDKKKFTDVENVSKAMGVITAIRKFLPNIQMNKADSIKEDLIIIDEKEDSMIATMIEFFTNYKIIRLNKEIIPPTKKFKCNNILVISDNILFAAIINETMERCSYNNLSLLSITNVNTSRATIINEEENTKTKYYSYFLNSKHHDKFVYPNINFKDRYIYHRDKIIKIWSSIY